MIRSRRFKPTGRLQHPHALEQEYARALRPVAVECLRAMETIVLPRLNTLGLPTGLVHQDAMVSARLGSLGEQATKAVIRGYDQELLRKMLRARANGVDDYQRRQLTAALVKATSITSLTGRLLQEDKADDMVEEFVSENAALITKLPEDYFKSIQAKIQKALAEGTRVETLAKQLKGTYEFPQNRAKLIARDQVGKLYGQLNQMRQKSVGIKTYIWRTMGDERVREGHEELDGSVQEWDSPPDTGEDEGANNPGEAIQCRCTGEPNLDELGLG